jgi:hypothetical protein
MANAFFKTLSPLFTFFWLALCFAIVACTSQKQPQDVEMSESDKKKLKELKQRLSEAPMRDHIRVSRVKP